jgi:hypothetical protein
VSTIQPTPPSAPTATSPATTIARITSGAEALANTRPGGTVQVQVVSVTPGGQVTLSAPGGEIRVQTPNPNTNQPQNQPPSQTPGQTPSPTPSQASGQARESGENTGSGRGPTALKPGDVYTLRTGPRGSETISLSPRQAAPATPAAQESAPQAPRAEGSVPTRLVPGAVTSATIIPRPGAPAASAAGPTAPPVPAQQTAPNQPVPATNTAPAGQSTQTQPPQTQATTQAPPTGAAGGSPAVTDGANVPAARVFGQAAGTPSPTGLAALARSGTNALLRTALQAARAITDGTPRQASPSGGSASAGSNSQQVNVRSGLTPNVTPENPATRAPSPSNRAPNQAPNQAPLPATPSNAPQGSGGGAYAARPSGQAGYQTSFAQAPAAGIAAPASRPPRGATGVAPPTRSPITGAPPTAGTLPGQPLPPTTATGGAVSASTSPAPSSLAAAAAAPATPTAAAAPTAPAATAASGTSNLAPTGVLAQFTQIERVDIRILSVQHPGSNTPNAASGANAPQGAVVSGTVIGLSRSGQSILSTPRGLMTLVGQADFPPGSRVAVEILPLSSRTGAARGSAPAPAPLAHLARHWETLDQAIRLLEVSNPSAANQITQNHVARPGPQLTAALALFITAVRGGDMRAWLGESNTRALEQMRGGLGATLREEFGTMSRASEPNDNGWRAFFIPFMDDGQFNQIRLFMNQERNARDGDGRDDASRTRFVVDLSLSQLGDLQIDGTVQPETVDLLIRTRDNLPEKMRQEIRDIFTSTLARTGIEGQLAFRIQKTFPTLPIEELHGYQDGPSSDLHI